MNTQNEVDDMEEKREMEESQLLREQLQNIEKGYLEKLGEVQSLKQTLVDNSEYVANTTRKYEELKEKYRELEEKWKNLQEIFKNAQAGGQ